LVSLDIFSHCNFDFFWVFCSLQRWLIKAVKGWHPSLLCHGERDLKGN